MVDMNQIEEVSVEFVRHIIEKEFIFDSFAHHLIDCRYPYEYEAGHIHSAANLYTPWQLLNYVFLHNFDWKKLEPMPEDQEAAFAAMADTIVKLKKPNSYWRWQAYIFYSESSSVRGLEMAKCLRNFDSITHVESHRPCLYFPRVFVMKNGYKEFYANWKKWGRPKKYVKMEISNPDNKITHVDLADQEDNDNQDQAVDDALRQKQLREDNACKRDCQQQMQAFAMYYANHNIE